MGRYPWRTIAFFESYFSNFIEGTEFLVDEAEDIVFSGRKIANRHADSHDVLSLYELTSDFDEISRVPESSGDFLQLLKRRHEFLMRARPDKNPGKFKTKRNQAGNTVFVEPERVAGTIEHAFVSYQTLRHPLARALFMMFVVTEVHPFDDGNGRLARVMMNAELVVANQTKIIVPIAHRDNYLSSLRRVSRDKLFQTYCKVLDQSQAYSDSVDWSDYGGALSKLEKDSAFKIPEEGLPIFNRALRGLHLSELPVDS